MELLFPQAPACYYKNPVPDHNNYEQYVARPSWVHLFHSIQNQRRTSVYPDRKTFAMWKIARIGRGKHQKAWEQEIRRVHNSNPLQRPSHVH